jgi:MFS transporter, DHA1 family, inner membrane transport protein
LPLSLLVLALSAFAIGTTEFVIMGLLPEMAASLRVSIPTAGWLVSGYALSVAVGAPIMVVATSRLPRKTALVALMGIFILGNVLCAVAGSFGVLMVARVITALCHGAFFGIGSVTAASLVTPDRKASAVALMFTGLTLANVLGVPFGTALGQAHGWRSSFWVIAAVGVLAFVALLRILPTQAGQVGSEVLSEIRGLRGSGIWIGFSTAVLFSAAMFALFTYIAPLLTQVTRLSQHGVAGTLFLIGVGLTVGNVAGGRLADWRLGATLLSVTAATALIDGVFFWSSIGLISAELTLFLWAMASFAGIPALQVSIVTFAEDSPNLASTLNIGAFNIGNALGAWVGGLVIGGGLGISFVPLAASALALGALCTATLSFSSSKKLQVQISREKAELR